jgi:hypothetical protein
MWAIVRSVWPSAEESIPQQMALADAIFIVPIPIVLRKYVPKTYF